MAFLGLDFPIWKTGLIIHVTVGSCLSHDFKRTFHEASKLPSICLFPNESSFLKESSFESAFSLEYHTVDRDRLRSGQKVDAGLS